MLLRRVIEHVKTQNWTAVGLDFIIVVVGVFIGIQVSNWNTSRADAQRDREFVERLAGNMAFDERNLIVARDYWLETANHGRDALQYLNTGEYAEGSQWRTILAFLHASQMNSIRFTDDAYQEMIGSGSLGAVGSIELRDRLGRLYSLGRDDVFLNTLFNYQSPYRINVRKITPIKIMDYYWEKCWIATPGNQINIICPAPISDQEATEILALYKGYPEMADNLRYWINNRRNAAYAAAPVLQQLEGLQNDLEQLLDRE